jgi:hypothetical protein
MDKLLLYSTIENGQGLRTEELEAMVQQYPWFSTAHLLLSKRYFDSHDHRFTEQLQRTALVAADRKVLYQLIHHSPQASASPVPEDFDSVTETQRTADVEEVRMRFYALDVVGFHPIQNESATQLAEDILLDEQIAPSTAKEESAIALPDLMRRAIPSGVSTPAIPEITEPPSPIIAEEPDAQEEITLAPPVQLRDLDALQQEILLEAVQSSIELEVGEEVGKDASDTPQVQSTPQTFAEWMAHRAMAISFAEVQTTAATDVQHEDSSDEESETADHVEMGDTTAGDETSAARARLAREATHAPLRPREGKQENLIDRFIRLEPRIVAGKVTDYTSGNLAKESLEEDFSLVTETMAQLFAKQGKLDKARKVYRKLMAEHPEKSVYFAAQLKKLDSYKKG